MKPVKGTVLIPLDQQPEESPQDPASVKVADSNLDPKVGITLRIRGDKEGRFF